MFRLTIFCDDRKLADVLHNLSGLILDRPDIQAVVNAEAKNGKLSAKTNGSLTERFAQYVKEHNLRTFPSSEARNIAQALGMAPASASYLLGQLRATRLIKSTGRGSKTINVVVR